MAFGSPILVHLSRIKMYIWVSSILFILLKVPHLVGGEQRFANEPSPQTAVVGSTVVLPCRVIDMVGELQWTRDGFGLGNERELYAFKRYQMIGSNEEGDYSLRISPVTLDDDSEFQCQVTGFKSASGVRSQTAKLTVYVPPEAPEILQGSFVQTTAGARVQLECLSKGGKPAAEIQWLDSSGRVISDGAKYTKYLLEDGHRYDSKSTLTLMAGREHHNTVFTCTASNPAIHQPLRTQVRLEVTYPPEVVIRQDRDGYKEGDTAILSCSAKANPNRLKFRWYRGSQLVSDLNETQLAVRNVSREVGLEDITCEVSNSVGMSKKITRISVHYGPSFRIKPKDVYAEEGENVTLKCQVDGSPQPKVVWIPQKNSSIFGSGPVLHLTASKETVGTYLCLAKVDDFPEISTTVGLFLKVPPTIKADRAQWGEVGSDVALHCFVPSATANSVTVTWSHKGERLDLANGRYEVSKEMTSSGLSVKLLIRRAKIEDFDTYNCSVQNDYGKDLVTILLKRKKTVPVLMVVTSVVGGILFILVIAGAVILFTKRSSSKHKDTKLGSDMPEKSISLQLNEQNSNENDSDLKVELDNQTGSSVSSRGAGDLEQSWEKEEPNVTPTFLSGNTSYLYPENFTGIPLKINGHVGGTGGGLTYADYTDHIVPTSNTATLQQKHLQRTLPSGFTLKNSGFTPTGSGFSPRTHHAMSGSIGGGPLVTSSQHNLFHGYQQQEFEPPPPSQESVEGLRGLSSAFSNGFANQSYKTNASTGATLPLALHLNRNSGINQSTTGVGILGTSVTVTQPVNAPNNRLGIPVDSSQYIVPPRTQLLQGALATHV